MSNRYFVRLLKHLETYVLFGTLAADIYFALSSDLPYSAYLMVFNIYKISLPLKKEESRLVLDYSVFHGLYTF